MSITSVLPLAYTGIFLWNHGKHLPVVGLAPRVREAIDVSIEAQLRRIKPRNLYMQNRYPLVGESNSDDFMTSTLRRRVSHILTGKQMPTRSTNSLKQEVKRSRSHRIMSSFLWTITNLRPWGQFSMALCLFVFHTMVLSQHSIPFLFQLLPNERGHFQSIGWDSLAGMLTLGAYQWNQWRHTHQWSVNQNSTASSDLYPNKIDGLEVVPFVSNNQLLESINDYATLPRLLDTPKPTEVPWKEIHQSQYAPLSSFVALLLLVRAYFYTGRLSLWWEDRFYELARYFPISVAMHRSLCVLMGHASWIGMGAAILRWIPRPQPFFPPPQHDSETPLLPSKWYKCDIRKQWLWWAVGGYFVSSWLFQISDFINSYLLPLSLLEASEQSSVVSQLINPEGQDWLASLIGYLGPCINAPWWEEILYRGFLLPAVALQFGYTWAVLLSGILFSIHHSSIVAFLPLCVLGWTWAIVYTKSQNLWTTIVIHSMWNSRIFIGSWLGV